MELKKKKKIPPVLKEEFLLREAVRWIPYYERSPPPHDKNDYSCFSTSEPTHLHLYIVYIFSGR